MAYNSKQVGTFVAGNGASGMLTYVTQDDNLTAVKGNNFFTSQFVKDFIRQQGVADGGNYRVPILVRASDGIEISEVFLVAASNQVQYNTAAAFVTT